MNTIRRRVILVVLRSCLIFMLSIGFGYCCSSIVNLSIHICDIDQDREISINENKKYRFLDQASTTSTTTTTTIERYLWISSGLRNFLEYKSISNPSLARSLSLSRSVCLPLFLSLSLRWQTLTFSSRSLV